MKNLKVIESESLKDIVNEAESRMDYKQRVNPWLNPGEINPILFDPFENTAIGIKRDEHGDLYEALSELGYEGLEDFWATLERVKIDLEKADQIYEFSTWLKQDGSKKSLLALI